MGEEALMAQGAAVSERLKTLPGEIFWDEEIEVILDDRVPEGEAWLTIEDRKRNQRRWKRLAIIKGLGSTEDGERP
jgi:hypothetical protein